VLWISKIWLPPPRPEGFFRALLILLPVSFFSAGCAGSIEVARVVEVRKFLNDNELDLITAGAASIDLELSAAAQGPTAVTSTQGSITTAHSTVLRIAVDPSAPEAARVRLLGVSAAELVLAIGNANATGTSNVQCSANATPVGDITYVAQSRNATAISAICSCSALAIGIVTQ
jgi:hypothetical protein